MESAASNVTPQEYRLADIKFDEYSLEKITKAFSEFQDLFSTINVSLAKDITEEDISKIPYQTLKAIMDLQDKVYALHKSFPKIRYAFEYKTLLSVLETIEKKIGFCDLSVTRTHNEMQKTFIQEKNVSVNVPFSEFKAIYTKSINNFSTKNFENLDCKVFFIETIVLWLMSKTGFEFNKKDIVDLRELKHVNEDVFAWVSQKLLASYISKKFEMYVPEGRNYFKCLAKRTDLIGKKMDISPTEFIFFEASLGEIKPNTYRCGVKFKYPDSTGIDYLATSKYIIMAHKVSLILTPWGNEVTLTVNVAMLKAQISSSIKSSFPINSKK